MDITKIPGVMRVNGWTRGAALMEQWFAGPANSNPKKGKSSVNYIAMDWVLQFSRAKAVYNSIVGERLWLNDKAKKEIIDLIRRKNLLGPGKGRQQFLMPRGTLGMENDYIQFRAIGGWWDMVSGPMDDLRAALANFVFRVVVGGTVEPILVDKKVTSGAPLKVESGKYRVTIDEVGIYVWDSYDFNDDPGEDQPLGNWNVENNTVGRTALNGGVAVSNSDFRNWRMKNSKGGDFLIYSNLYVLQQRTNNQFEF